VWIALDFAKKREGPKTTGKRKKKKKETPLWGPCSKGVNVKREGGCTKGNESPMRNPSEGSLTAGRFLPTRGNAGKQGLRKGGSARSAWRGRQQGKSGE